MGRKEREGEGQVEEKDTGRLEKWGKKAVEDMRREVMGRERSRGRCLLKW